MNAMSLAQPLIDVLGARWRVEVKAHSVAWNNGIAGFGLADGSVALAPSAWDGAPLLRPRDGGGAELVPATAPAPPVARAPAHQGECLAVAADPDAGFLTGGVDGQVARVLADGEVRVLAVLDAVVTCVAAGPGGWRACASGRTVHRLGGSASRIDVDGTITAMAVEPSGARVAIGHTDGVVLWAGGSVPRVVDGLVPPVALSWSRDGSWLACADPDGALRAWGLSGLVSAVSGGPIVSLSSMVDGFAVGAGGRVLRWRPGKQPDSCGVPNQASVTRVSCHPHRALVAAGYANGAVVLCQPDSAGLLFLRAAGEGAVSVLAFSPEGDHLAMGTDGGEIGVLTLPAVLFRNNAGTQ